MSNNCLVISGGRPLTGEVYISGAKNSALPLIASALLFDHPFTLYNVPRVRDVYTMLELIEVIGSEYEWQDKNTLKIYPKIIRQVAPYQIVEKMRASIYVLGPLLAKTGYAKVSFPGGCNFGPRPINFHLEGLKKMGAEIEIEKGFIIARAKKLHGAKIVFDQKSVGSTIHLMMAASLIEDTTIIENAAKEPEVVQVAEFLNSSGARIEGIGGDTLIIHGNTNLKPQNYVKVIPDRIEAGTFLVIGSLPISEKIVVRNVIPEHLTAVLEKLSEAGADYRIMDNRIEIKPSKGLGGIEITTAPFPGFPTDMQAQFTALLSIAKGVSIVRETIYPSRFHHAYELQRMGANIEVKEGEAIIRGVEKLYGTVVNATDLRASASLVIAGLMADGITLVKNIYHLERGYEDFEKKLSALGASIKRRSF